MMNQPNGSIERLSFGEAARLAGVPKAYLRELAESGRLAVHLFPKDGETKLRVTATSLIEAGVLPLAAEPGPDGGTVALHRDPRDLSELVALIREQSDRITSLEEQRFQLGAQLGAALERIASLEERIEALPSASLMGNVVAAVETSSESGAPDLLAADETEHHSERRLRDVAWRLTDAGFRHSARLGAGLLRLRTRQRRIARHASSSPAD